MLFSDKDKLRELYNAITGSKYSEETPMTINTLNDVLGISLRNDISFTIEDKTIVLMEHQSTINPNMPVRFLFYIAALYEKMILKKELYGEKKLEIPEPEFYLFYNGKAPYPEETTLKLSHSFKKRVVDTSNFLELEVKVYNINAGYNKTLMEKSRDLGEFALFVEKVREKQNGLSKKAELEEAFRLAIIECIEHNILKEFLETHGEEVMKNLLNITREEYIAIRLESAQEIGYEKGVEKGLEKGKEEGLNQAKLETARELKAMGLSVSQIAKATKLSFEEIEKL